MDIDSPFIGAYLAGGATEAERAAVNQWRSAHPDNERQFQSRARIWAFAECLPPESLDMTLEVIDDGSGGPAPLSVPIAVTSAKSHRTFHFAAAIAAAVVGLVAFGLLPLERFGDTLSGVEHVTTGPGEIATVVLRDGTIIRLGPESRLGFQHLAGHRDVFLEGQAYFAVRHENRAPFRVFTEGGEVTVLGTRFDIEAREANVRVVVVEGAVEMRAGGESLSIVASEMASTREGERALVEAVEDVYSATAWIGEFLAYGSTPLSTIALEFEQRFGLQVQIADSVLARRTVTGWFRDQSPLEALASICFVVNASCFDTGDGIRVENPLPAGIPGTGGISP